MSSNKSKSSQAEVAMINLLIAGMQKNIPPTSSLVLQGGSLTQPVIISRLQGMAQQYQDVTDAKSTWQDKVATLKGDGADNRAFVQELKAAIKLTLGKSSPLLASFGIAVPKPRPAKTSIEKAMSQAAAANTKAVRGTNLSQKARQSITTTGKPGLTVTNPDGSPMLKVDPVPPGQPAVKRNVTVGGGAAPAPAAGPAETPAPATPAGTDPTPGSGK